MSTVPLPITLHYFATPAHVLLRPGPLRLLLLDSNTPFTNAPAIRHQDWKTVQQTLVLSGDSPYGCLPLMEFGDGRRLSQTHALLVYLSDMLGAYGGKSAWERYQVEAVADVLLDLQKALGVPPKPMFTYLTQRDASLLHTFREQESARFLQALEGCLTKFGNGEQGPYVLGAEVTYADFFLYCQVWDLHLGRIQGLADSGYPKIARLMQAVRARPNLQAFLSATEADLPNP